MTFTIFKKTLLTLVFFSFIYAQISNNLNFVIPQILPLSVQDKLNQNKFLANFSILDYGIKYPFTKISGLLACWAAYTPIVTYSWSHEFIGTYQNGTQIILDFPHKQDSLWAGMIHYWETKYLDAVGRNNIFELSNNEFLCRTLEKSQNRIASIQHYWVLKQINTPEHKESTSQVYGLTSKILSSSSNCSNTVL